jgi:Tfp pilus assembly protein PilN
MRTLALDYRRTPRAAERAGIALLALGAAAAIGMGLYYDSLSQSLVLWETRAEQLERLVRHDPARVRQASLRPAQLDTEFKEARKTLLKLALPWNDLFKAVESSDDKDVALLGIDPDVQKDLVTISGEARSIDAMLHYVKTLQDAPSLSEVFLRSHQVQQQDPEHPVHFTIEATWTLRP